MADARDATLLQFAIGASAAVVPVLLGVLLVVASQRPGGDAPKAARESDRHVSVRLVAALKTFEHAIVRRDRVSAPPPAADTLLERVPQCRTEWDGRGGALTRARLLLARSEPRSTPAARIAAQLLELDDALLRFSSRENRRVSEAVGFDSARWFDAVAAAMQTPIEAPGYPGQRFTLQCADIATAVLLLGRGNGRMLGALAWRGTEVQRTIERWRSDQFVAISARHVSRVNPWSGIPGCIYFGNSAHADADATTYFVAGARGLDDALCTRVEMRGISSGHANSVPAVRIAGEPKPDMPVGDERWKVPPSLGAMLQPLDTLHRPTGSLYRAYTDVAADANDTATAYRYGPNRLDVGGAPVDVGFSIDLTIDPRLQALAQQTAACYTGRGDVCRALDMRRKEDGGATIGHRMLEHAVVRMAAIAIVDVETGRIDALAGALSPCTREEFDGPGRSARCDKRLPYPIRYRPDALLNAAVFHDAMPASTIKPIMAAAFLTDAGVGARWLAAEREQASRNTLPIPSADSLRGQLMRSNSARFLDRMFCADRRFAACDRPWSIRATALSFGWNEGCDRPREQCGKHDLLFGRAVDAAAEQGVVQPLALVVPYGRLLTEPVGGRLGAPLRMRPDTPLDTARVRQCAAGADGVRLTPDDWEKCAGGVIVDVVAEGWGQGHARATALGAAGMMATLAAAANGQTRLRRPHLVAALRGVGTDPSSDLKSAVLRWSLADPEVNPLPQDVAGTIIDALSYTHRAGTARRACEQVFDPRACRDIDWIAGKTGTPTFPTDDRTLDELAHLCRQPEVKSRTERAACGPLRPYKWYVAAYRGNPSHPRWTKVIAVLTERNWLADSGRIHGAGDHGPNPAAEIAMQIAGRDVGLLRRSGE